ncbi:MAG: FkbM family methyltransferase [Bacteroidetes bacterium]|nr:FkbM family methyltransferase [Bacteroidota bacterium]
MDFNYTKIRLGNWLYKNCFPLYNYSYKRFKLKNDRDEIDLLKKLILPGFHVLDIGANIGFYAEVISEIAGATGRVYCFEPDQQNFSYLKKNTAAFNNISLFNNAVSDLKGSLKVYKSKLLNVDHRTYPVSNYDSIEEIEAVTIDDLIQQNKIEKVDFIKIDIQGYELSAFKGMQQLLKSAKDLQIIAEYWPHGFKRAGTSGLEFFEFFERMGYKFFLIENGELTPLGKNYIIQHNDQPFEFSFNILIKK